MEPKGSLFTHLESFYYQRFVIKVRQLDSLTAITESRFLDRALVTINHFTLGFYY